MCLRKTFLSICIALSTFAGAQRFTQGFNAGLVISFGTHFQRLGVSGQYFIVSHFFQANTAGRIYFNFRGLGPRGFYPEAVISQGVVFGYGAHEDLANPFFSPVSNQTGYRSSVAYSYNVYLNRKLTTQQTGIVALEFGRCSLISENDLFARPWYDRFRTAAFLLQYQYLDIVQAGINCTMWTGQMGQKRGIGNSDFHFHCYMDTTNAVYPYTSAGLLSAQVKYNVGYGQNVQVNAGVDAEQVRNAVQNRLIHDMRFIPKRWNKTVNCHIPMLDEGGGQYLYQPGQRIRKPKPFVNAHANAMVFY